MRPRFWRERWGGKRREKEKVRKKKRERKEDRPERLRRADAF